MTLSWQRIEATAQVFVNDVSEPKLDDETTHHLLRVLRVRDGEAVTVSDGKGNWALVTIKIVDSKELELVPPEKVNREPAPEKRLGIAFAPLRRTATNQLIQQCTEIGIDDFFPVITAFTNTDIDSLRNDRLEKIVMESSAQCRRVWLPTVHPPTAWPNFHMTRADVARADFVGDPVDLAEVTVIAIGPEGGWSQAEREENPRALRLPGEVLRAETAAVVAAAALIGAHREG